jgi:hypothetical protein
MQKLPKTVKIPTTADDVRATSDAVGTISDAEMITPDAVRTTQGAVPTTPDAVRTTPGDVPTMPGTARTTPATVQMTPGASIVQTTPRPRSCLIPKLSVDDPEIQEYLRHWDAMECSKQRNWVYTSEGSYYINETVVQNYTNVTCDYYNIVRVHDDKQSAVLYPNYPNGSKLLDDGFKVICRGLDRDMKEINYTNVHFGVPLVTLLHDSEPPKRDFVLNSHVFMYLLDSLSRINFIRKLPKFYKFLTDQMDAVVMEGFNIVGDGTPWTLIPMTTGFFQTELPESRKRFWNASYLDEWPFIFRDYHNAGYATAYVEEQPAWSAFSYKIKGFWNKPVVHYLRTALLYADDEVANHEPYCLGDTPKSIIWIKYWKELIDMYEGINRKTLSMMFSAETSHESYNYVESLDDHFVEHFGNLFKEGRFNNTFLIIMGDHGRRFGAVRGTQSGRLEEKLPFFAIVPPPWFKRKYPKSYRNLLENKDALMTPFDIHATLKHLLEFKEDGEMGDVKNRGISLLKKIPEFRTCKQASIKPHFCSCLEWRTVTNLKDVVVVDATNYVIERFNQMNDDAKGICSILSLKSLLSVRILKPNDDLLSFVQSSDFDNISGDLSGSKNLSAIVYQIRFVTSPNDADYDVSITYHIEQKKYSMNMEDVSRLNLYGDQAKCIYQTHQHLRQFCHCKN